MTQGVENHQGSQNDANGANGAGAQYAAKEELIIIPEHEEGQILHHYCRHIKPMQCIALTAVSAAFITGLLGLIY